MKKSTLSSLALAALIAVAVPAHAQNVAIVNGKPVPKARVDALLKQVNQQAAAQGQQLPPLEEVKPQIQQRLGQQKLAAFRDEIRAKAKTDYKFN